jgi:DNA repair exonuclease SbcCD ATPase subunit
VCERRSSLRLAFWLSSALLFSAAYTWADDVPAQTLQTLSHDIEQSLLPSLAESTTLRERLEVRKIEQQAQVETWKRIAESLQAENETERQKSAEEARKSIESSAILETAQAALSQSQTELTATLKSLDALKANSEQLSTGFDDYKAEAEARIKKARLEALVVKIAAVAGWVALAVFMVL